MRRMLVVWVAVVGAMVLPVPAAVAAPPLTEADGLRLVRSSSGEWLLRFRPEAKRAYRRVAGRKVKVACHELTREPGGLSIEGTLSGSAMRAPKHGRTVRTFTANRGTDLCEFRVRGDLFAVVAGTADGRLYLDELQTFGLMLAPFLFAEGTTPDQVVAAAERAGFAVVALDGPDAVPPAGRSGYWTDGTRLVFARLTSAGRRLFLEYDGDVVRTNGLPYLTAD